MSNKMPENNFCIKSICPETGNQSHFSKGELESDNYSISPNETKGVIGVQVLMILLPKFRLKSNKQNESMQHFRNIQDELIEKIKSSKKSLKIAVTWFTNHDIFNAIIKKLENPEFEVSLIVLNDRINNKNEGVNFQQLIDCNGNFYFSSVDQMVHHKFCIIDDKAVITGSYNWTYYAENRNWENIVVLKSKEAVKAYIEEFDKVINTHEKVVCVSEKRKLDYGMNSQDYLITDYKIQAKQEEHRGNDLPAAKLYTEILKLNSKLPEIQKARSSIIQKVNEQQFTTCPFEIGIKFKHGYVAVIPAFTPLPFTAMKDGKTTVDNATALNVDIRKYDYTDESILVFPMEDLKVAPAGTPKLRITMTVKQDWFLTVVCRELNGYGRSKTKKVDLKRFL